MEGFLEEDSYGDDPSIWEYMPDSQYDEYDTREAEELYLSLIMDDEDSPPDIT